MVNLYLGWQIDPALFRKEREEYLQGIERKYGKIGLKRYLLAEEEQKGKCKICLRKMILVADHKHGTRRFRGLICAWCNGFLGKVEKMPWILSTTAAYLKIKL